MARKRFDLRSFARGALAIVVFLILWEIGSRSKQWLGADIFAPVRDALGAMGFKKNYLPWIGAVPAPTEVLQAWAGVITDASYWQSWYKSSLRVLAGFTTAMVVGIPFGLLLAVNRTAFGIGF